MGLAEGRAVCLCEHWCEPNQGKYGRVRAFPPSRHVSVLKEDVSISDTKRKSYSAVYGYTPSRKALAWEIALGTLACWERLRVRMRRRQQARSH